MSISERMQQSFDITPEQGVGLAPPSPAGMPRNEVAPSENSGATDEQEPREQYEKRYQAESPDLEDVEPEETDTDEQQEAGTLPRMSSFDFAEAAGVAARDIYEQVEFKTARGPKSAKDIVEEYERVLETQGQWEQERQQLQEKVHRAESAQVTQAYSPEAQKAEMQAEFLEQQYGSINWEQVPAEQRADLKIEYDRNINQLRRLAQQKQAEFDDQLAQKRRDYANDVDRQIRSDIPEWNSREVYSRETAAISDFLRASYGMPDQQISAIAMDPVSTRIVRDLWQLTAKQAKIKDGATKIRKISKSLKPGSRRSAKKGNSLDDVGKRVREAGSRSGRQDIRMNADIQR